MAPQTQHWLAMTLVLALTFVGTHAFVVMGCGSCPEPEVKKDFDVTRYMGRWFEYVRYPNTFQMGTKCVVANYTLNDDMSVRVVNSGIQEVSYGLGLCPWYTSRIADGDATIENKDESAKLGVRFSEYSPRGTYWVLETDYVNYSVVYGCSQVGYLPMYTQTLWVLTRQRGVAPQDLSKIYVRVNQKGLEPSYFEMSDQKGCPDWPKPN